MTFQSTPPHRWRLLHFPVCHFHRIFQSTPPHRWRLSEEIGCLDDKNFQSTPPHRWRLHGTGDVFIEIDLSIHSTTQVETLLVDGVRGPYIFQSTPPHRWRLDPGEHCDCRKSFQSTPPHRWRLFSPLINTSILDLSIHSTTQVETAISYNIIQDFLLISNKLTIISYIYHQFLLHILSITIPFCIFFWCESPWNFMFA